MKRINSICKGVIAISVIVLFTLIQESVLAEETGQVIYKNDFTSELTFAEDFKSSPKKGWIVKSGKLVAPFTGVSVSTLKKAIPESAILNIDVIPKNSNRDFAGISIYGVKFLLRPDGFWDVYSVEGKKRSLGKFKKEKIEVGKKYSFKITSQLEDGSRIFEWLVNDIQIMKFKAKGKIKGKNKFYFVTNKMSVEYGNLVITEIGKK